jgi:hypothetical protein
MTKEQTIQEIKDIEKIIEIANKTKEDAINAKTATKTKMDIAKGELSKYGVTPETADEVSAKMQKENEELIEQIKDKLPIPLLQSLHRL